MSKAKLALPKINRKAVSHEANGDFLSLGRKGNPFNVYTDTDDTFEAILRSYEHTQQWIVFADTKAGLILAVNGVLIGFMLQQMAVWKNAILNNTQPTILYACAVPIGLYFVFQIASFLCIIKVFSPRMLPVDYMQCRHIFNVGICKAFPKPADRERFWNEYKNLSEEDFKREYVYQLHTDSLVCVRKYTSLRYGIKTLIASFPFAFISLITTGIFLK